MKKIYFLFAFGVCLAAETFAQIERKEMGNIVSENIPEFPKSLTEKLNQYQSVRTAGLVSWLPDGKGMLISTRFAETAQLHLVEMPGGARKQITFFTEPISNAVFPENTAARTFYFVKDVGGGEFYQIFSFDINTGKYEMLTDGTSRNGFPRFSNKGDKFIFTSTRRNKKDSDFYISDLKNPKTAKLLLENNTNGWSAADWSPDDKTILVEKYVSVNESFVYLMDAETGKLSPINETKKGVAYGGIVFSKDGKGIFMTSDENTEFQQLRYYDLEKKTFKNLTANLNWDVEDLELSPDGKTLAFTSNEDGIAKLYLMDTQTQTYKPVSNLPIGLIGGLEFHPDSKKLAMSLTTSQTPSDVFVLELASNKLERWTFSEVGGLNTETFVSPKLIQYETFDKVNGKPRMIPAFYYKPKNDSGKIPVIISIHGGPEGQSRPGFASLYQFLLNEMGIAVLVPNVRGSTGYGKTFVSLDNGFKREESVQDIGKLLDWVAKQPDLDASRVMVYGGSYGGYMVLACMTNFNDRLKGGVDLFGISNFVTFLEKTEAYRRDLRRVEYGDERDPKMKEHLTKISPVNNSQKITKPMFVYQGLNDPRVPVGESEQMVKALRGQGVTVWYMLAKDEGHSLAKKTNRDFHTAAMMLFLEKFMLNGQ